MNIMHLQRQLIEKLKIYVAQLQLELRLRRWAKEIQVEEGYYAPGHHPAYPTGTRSWRNNSPGNMKYTTYTASLGAIRADTAGFAVFATYEDGRRALVQFLKDAISGVLKRYKPDMTLVAFCTVYVEDIPSTVIIEPLHYGKNIARRLGISEFTKIRDI